MSDVDPVSQQRRRHRERRRALHSLSLRLARHPGLVAHSRRLAAGRDRVARIAILFEFVRRLATHGDAREGPGAMTGRVLEAEDVAAAVLWAMLRAVGERAGIDYTREVALVRVALQIEDVGLLPPWARLLRAPGRLELALAPAAGWRPAGYLPPPVRAALQRRRGCALPDAAARAS